MTSPLDQVLPHRWKPPTAEPSAEKTADSEKVKAKDEPATPAKDAGRGQPQKPEKESPKKPRPIDVVYVSDIDLMISTLKVSPISPGNSSWRASLASRARPSASPALNSSASMPPPSRNAACVQ